MGQVCCGCKLQMESGQKIDWFRQTLIFLQNKQFKGSVQSGEREKKTYSYLFQAAWSHANSSGLFAQVVKAGSKTQAQYNEGERNSICGSHRHGKQPVQTESKATTWLELQNRKLIISWLSDTEGKWYPTDTLVLSELLTGHSSECSCCF